MSYKCTKCNYISLNNIEDDLNPISDDITCSKCKAKHSIIKIDCIYCDENDKDAPRESTHFCCEECGVGMCDICYEHNVEHDYHYYDVGKNCEDDLYDKLKKHFGGHTPTYICEKCLDKIENY